MPISNYPKFYRISAYVWVIMMVIILLKIWVGFAIPYALAYPITLLWVLSTFGFVKWSIGWAKIQKLNYLIEVENVRNKHKIKVISNKRY